MIVAATVATAGPPRTSFLGQKLDDTTLARCLVAFGVQSPEAVYRQAVVESGHFRSKLASRANNLFGMRVATSRQTTAAGAYMGYARYSHWSLSVYDYLLWQERVDVGPGSYYDYLLRRRYAQNRAYIKALRSVIVPAAVRAILSETRLQSCSSFYATYGTTPSSG